MIAAIRIRGLVGVNIKIRETLNRLKLRKKYVCILLEEKPEILGMLKKVKNYISYGKISEEILKKLLIKRGKFPGNKSAKEKISDSIVKDIIKGKKLKEVGLKNFFRLHPPKGGFKKSTRLEVPRGILGFHSSIDKLLEKMI